VAANKDRPKPAGQRAKMSEAHRTLEAEKRKAKVGPLIISIFAPPAPAKGVQ
jgi:hypothetical protein